MNTRICKCFEKAKEEGRAAFVAYLTIGYPSLEASEKAIDRLIAESGADIIELGVPFSDPFADGAVIRAAAYEALKQGVTMTDVLALAARVRAKHPETPLVVFSYYNLILSMGSETFAAAAEKAGVDAVLAVDLPLEERDELLKPCRGNGLHVIPLVSPLTPTERIRAICEGMSGFIYCINVAGVTGARAGLPAGCTELIRRVKSCTPLPVASGFGIADPRSAAAAAECADGVIAGSGFVRALEEGVEAAGRFVRGLAEAIR